MDTLMFTLKPREMSFSFTGSGRLCYYSYMSLSRLLVILCSYYIEHLGVHDNKDNKLYSQRDTHR